MPDERVDIIAEHLMQVIDSMETVARRKSESRVSTFIPNSSNLRGKVILIDLIQNTKYRGLKSLDFKDLVV